MKKLSTFLFTIIIWGITFTSLYASNCNIISSSGLSNSRLEVTYVNEDDSSGTVQANYNYSVLLPYNTKSITNVQKLVTLDFSSDEVILQGALQFVSFNDSANGSINPNVPNVNNIPAPTVVYNGDNTKRSYCEFLNTSISSNQNFIQDLGSTSTTLITPRLSSFSFTLKCYRNNDFPNTSATYRILFPLYFNFFPNTELSLNTDYYISANFLYNYLQVSNSCSLDDILGEIQSLGYDITDIKDSITDTNISNSVTEFEDQLNDWSVDNHGLSAFVTAPLSFISSLTQQNTCTPITLPPLIGNTSTFVLPCIMEEFEDKFPSLFSIYQIAIYFFVCYRIGIDLFLTVHKLKDPLNDEISVADI